MGLPGGTRFHSRSHCGPEALPGALYPAAAAGLPTLSDKAYQGAGIGVHTPIKGRNLAIDNRPYNKLLSGLRAIGERANALLTQRWKALRHVSLSPSRIGAIAAAVLVLTTLERGSR